MISNRNVDPKLNYEVLSTYSGGAKKELKKSKSLSIEEAIDNTVRKVPGGEFLMNAKVYLIKGAYIAVEGDVWGVKTNSSFRGFKVGDKVTWKAIDGYKVGTIKSLKDGTKCIIEKENGELIDKKFEEISIAE